MKRVALLCLLLAGCGGGGGGEAGPSIDPAQLKGRWVTASGAAPAVTAKVYGAVPPVAVSVWL